MCISYLPARRIASVALCFALGLLATTETTVSMTFASDKDALMALARATDSLANQWASGIDPCLEAWGGVTCSGDEQQRVIKLDLHSLGLTGSISAEVGRLSALTRLSLANNSLTGPIPLEIGNLSRLTFLDLSSNALSGPIPLQLGDLLALTRLDLSHNNLTDPIPANLGNLSALKDLFLYENRLSGPIPAALGNISSLATIYLYGNKLTGAIPSELGRLSMVSSLEFSENNLDGPIPRELGNLVNLTYLSLGSNTLSGAIPFELGQLSRLEILFLRGNNLTGPIAAQLGNLTHLRLLDLGSNILTGPIPPEFGNLSSLSHINLSLNNLTGSVPPELGRCRNLTRLFCDFNLLTGTIPPGLAGLSKLDRLSLANNQLQGSIPPELALLTQLDGLFLNDNNLTGLVPPELANLSKLTQLDLSKNSLLGPIPLPLTNLSLLRSLKLSSNRFNGTIPPFRNHSSLVVLDLSNNHLDGPIPSALSELSALTTLNLSRSLLSGAIPGELVGLKVLQFLDLSHNRLSERLAANLGLLPSLEVMDLSHNNIPGTIPEEFGNLLQITSLDLSNNQLSELIPAELFTLGNLKLLDLSENDLRGDIPPDLSAARSLSDLRLAGNRLQGEIPSALGRLSGTVDLSNNTLSGPIPPDTSWDPTTSKLSGNFLNGTVPEQLANASVGLNCLSLESGDFQRNGQRDAQNCSGFYPMVVCTACHSSEEKGLDGLCRCVVSLKFQAVFRAGDSRSLGNFSGNVDGTLRQLADVAAITPAQVKAVGSPRSNLRRRTVTLDFMILPLAQSKFPENAQAAIRERLTAGASNVTVPFFDRGYELSASDLAKVSPNDVVQKAAIGAGTALAVLLVALLVVFVLWRRRQRRRSLATRIPETSVMGRTLSELRQATDNFNKANEIGRGAFGTVYKGMLGDIPVAVKRLNFGRTQGWEEFMSELTIIGGIHNRNLVNLQGYCVEGGEHILVFDYMAKGSLQDALFKEDGRPPLEWDQCVQILLGTAQAIAYLHEGCSTKIIHRDIKPANILLDSEFVAKVCDFGLARCTPIAATHASTNVKGTPGYVAPEYQGTGQLTDKSDVYSFGMVILVVISCNSSLGFLRGSNFIGLSTEAFILAQQGREMELVSPRFAAVCDERQARRFISVALLCIQPDWESRPSMGNVVQMLSGNMDLPPLQMHAIVTFISREGFSSSSASSTFPSS